MTGGWRVTLRDLSASPGYTAAAVLTLALVVAANSAIFGAVYAVLLKPSSIQDPDRLVMAWDSAPSRNVPVVELSYRNFQNLTTQSRSFTHAAAVGSSTWPTILHEGGESTRLAYLGVSASFFDTLGARPLIGRTFSPEDDVSGATRVTILSHALWVHRFGADPAVIGRSINLDQPHVVIGVMPPDFDFPRRTDLWIPVVPSLASAGEAVLERVGVLFLLGRLRPGVTATTAAEELNQIASRLKREGNVEWFGSAMIVTPFLDYHVGPVRHALWALFAAVAVLLLIGCANVSGLMLTRLSLRQRDHAIRMALGSTRAHLARRWVFEAVTLAIAGGLCGFIASHWLLRGIIAVAPDDIPRLSDIAINLPVAAFTLVAVATTALLCGIQPILQAGRADLSDTMPDAARTTPGPRSQRARSTLLILQIAMTVVLMIAAGLVLRSFVNLRTVNLGFLPAKVLTMTVTPRDGTPAANEWIDGLLRRVRTLPQVEAAGSIALRPLALGPIGSDTWVILDGQSDSESSRRLNPTLNYQVATTGYFEAMGTPVVQGRLFDDRDDDRTGRVAVISESTAKALWPGQDPIGRRIMMPNHSADGDPNIWRTVIGVVGDVRYRGIDDARLDVYDAALQAPMVARDLVIRTSDDPLKLAAAVQAEARRLDPRVVIDQTATMDAIVSRAVAPWRFSTWMFTLFAAVACVLATVGLVSVVSLDVAYRRREFAVRLAVGAQRRDIRDSVLRSAFRRIIPGLTIGLLCAIAAARVIRHILFEIEPVDPTTYLTVTMLVISAVFGASWGPAHRASATDPLSLLKP